jgi:tetratricopeptide (TPR) repeat protein
MTHYAQGREVEYAPLQALVQSGRFREALAHYFRSADSTGSATPQSRLLAAQAAARIGEFEVSARLAASARAAFESADDVDGLLEATSLLGAIAFGRGKIKDAEKHFAAVADLAERHGRARFTARGATNLGNIASLRGEPEIARGFYQRGLEVFEMLGDARGIAETCHDLALELYKAGALALAREANQRAVERAEQVGEAGLIALTLLGRAELRIESGALEDAREDIERAERLAWDEGNQPHRLEGERLLAVIALRSGDPAEAYRLAALVHARAAEAQFAVLAAEARSLAALALKALGRHTEAVASRDVATVALRSLGASGHLARLSRDWESI